MVFGGVWGVSAGRTTRTGYSGASAQLQALHVFFAGGLCRLGLDIWTSTLRHLLRCWKTSPSRPPAASERVLRKALPIIPLCREELAPSCRGCCRLQRDHWERGREKENKRKGTAKVEERWPRCLCQRALESILSLFVYNWSCGVWCSTTQNCNNSPFYDVVLTFPKLGCWPGTVTLCMIYCAADYMLHYWC